MVTVSACLFLGKVVIAQKFIRSVHPWQGASGVVSGLGAPTASFLIQHVSLPWTGLKTRCPVCYQLILVFPFDTNAMHLPLSGLLNLMLPLNLPSFWRFPNPIGGGVVPLSRNPISGAAVPLSPEQFDAFVPYMEFARAAYCKPEKITGWQCGGQFFSFSPTPFLPPLSTRLLIGPKALAVPFQILNRRLQVETATVPNTVSVATILHYCVPLHILRSDL